MAQKIGLGVGCLTESLSALGIGLASSEVTQTPDWLLPQQKCFNLLVSHQDQVTLLPTDASLVATNDFCPIAGYQVNHSILTFQGHPEFSRDYLQHIMTNRRQIIGEQVYQQAMKSLQHNEVVANWIVNFIRYKT